MHGQTLVKVLRRFADHDWPWYSRLARAVGDHPPMDLSAIDIPVTYLAGTWDAITSAKQMRAASERRHTVDMSNLPPRTLCRCSFRAGCQPSSATSLIAVLSASPGRRRRPGPPPRPIQQAQVPAPVDTVNLGSRHSGRQDARIRGGSRST